MEVSAKERFQKKAALVATKISIGGTSEWQFGEMRDSPDCMKDSERKGGRSKEDAEGVDAFRR